MKLRACSVFLWILATAAAAAQAPLPGATPPPEPTLLAAKPSTPTRTGLALVIGNSRYAQAELPTVETDRSTMAKALKSLGFKVREAADLQRPRDFQEELQTFLKSENAEPEDILLVYYSGHGLQIEGKPYLLGTGIKSSADMSSALREYSQDVDAIIRAMEQSAPTARVLIVDACRNNAFAQTARKAGVSFQPGVEDTYIMFADEPGKTVPARSETSLQSPFTAGLLFAFENSDEGIERRFEIAKEKTRELNPDQVPQLVKSESSANRSRPFLDQGGRAVPARSAGHMLNDAEELYRIGSWNDFRAKVHAARVLSSEDGLNARLDKELAFSDLVIAARAAEAEANGKWTEAGAAWQKASALFTSRLWTLERAALSWLLADRVQEAVGVLAHLKANAGTPIGDRAVQMLASLLQADPSLEGIVKSVNADPAISTGPEFEKYVIQR